MKKSRLLDIVTILIGSMGFTSLCYAVPISSLYLTTNGHSVVEVQNGIVNTWTTGGDEYAIAVDGTVRTSARTDPFTGAEYTLAGVATGNSYAAPNLNILDGATDGSFNYGVCYIVEECAGNVYRFSTDWSNPQLLFNTGNIWDLGITYDPSNNSFVVIFLCWGHNKLQFKRYVAQFVLRGHDRRIAWLGDGLADHTLWLSSGTNLLSCLRQESSWMSTITEALMHRGWKPISAQSPFPQQFGSSAPACWG